MPCVLAQFVENIETKNDLNALFDLEEIPVFITYIDLSDEKQKAKLFLFLEEEVECAHRLADEDEIPIVVVDLENQKWIAVIILKMYDGCIYIVYRCVSSLYRQQGWGEFLTFLTIFFSKMCFFRYIFANGVSSIKTKTTYERRGGYHDIDVSQYINITKFGFEDFYKADTFSIERAKQFALICGEYPETVLDLLLGDLVMYETYKRDLFQKPLIKFASFLKHKKHHSYQHS